MQIMVTQRRVKAASVRLNHLQPRGLLGHHPAVTTPMNHAKGASRATRSHRGQCAKETSIAGILRPGVACLGAI